MRTNDSCFSVIARRNGRQPARLGLAISKKLARRAVDRSRLKRLVRESFRQRRHNLCGVDVVVMCRPGTLNFTNRRLFDSLIAHWDAVREKLCVSF